MTREHSQSQASSSKCSTQRLSIGGGRPQQLKPDQQDSAASATTPGGVGSSSGDRRPQSDSARSAPLRGSSLFQKRQQQLFDATEQQQQQHLNHQHHHQSDSRKTFSDLEESSGTAMNFHCGGGRQNRPSLSSDDQHLDSKCSEGIVVSPQNRVLPSMVLKKQTIYYEGKFKTVFVQVWPGRNRIPMHQRHRLQDPMRQRYGKLSLKARLVKEFEHYDKPRSDDQPIPLLPKRMREEAKVRLMAWYRPLDIRCGHSLPEAVVSSRRSSQALSTH